MLAFLSLQSILLFSTLLVLSAAYQHPDNQLALRHEEGDRERASHHKAMVGFLEFQQREEEENLGVNVNNNEINNREHQQQQQHGVNTSFVEKTLKENQGSQPSIFTRLLEFLGFIPVSHSAVIARGTSEGKIIALDELKKNVSEFELLYRNLMKKFCNQLEDANDLLVLIVLTIVGLAMLIYVFIRGHRENLGEQKTNALLRILKGIKERSKRGQRGRRGGASSRGGLARMSGDNSISGSSFLNGIDGEEERLALIKEDLREYDFDDDYSYTPSPHTGEIMTMSKGRSDAEPQLGSIFNNNNTNNNTQYATAAQQLQSYVKRSGAETHNYFQKKQPEQMHQHSDMDTIQSLKSELIRRMEEDDFEDGIENLIQRACYRGGRRFMNSLNASGFDLDTFIDECKKDTNEPLEDRAYVAKFIAMVNEMEAQGSSKSNNAGALLDSEATATTEDTSLRRNDSAEAGENRSIIDKKRYLFEETPLSKCITTSTASAQRNNL